MYFPRLTFTFAAADTTKSQTLVLAGPDAAHDVHWEKETFEAVAILSAFATAVSATVSLVNHKGSTVYSIAGLLVNGTSYLQFSRKIQDGSYFTVTLNDVAGAGGGTVTIDLSGN